MTKSHTDCIIYNKAALQPACVVYLCATPVPHGLSWLAAWAARFLSLSSPPGSNRPAPCADSTYRHWSVASVRRGGKVVVLQASKQSVTGNLTIFMSYWATDSFFVNGTKKIKLGSLHIPHERVQNILNEMSDSRNMHDPASYNCRKWALELLHRLEFRVPALDEYQCN